jgi:hypothetical protein
MSPVSARGPHVEPAALDTARFGISVLHARPALPGDVDVLVAEARARGAALVVVRGGVRDHAVIHRLEQAGALLMSSLMYLERSLVVPPVPTEYVDLLRAATVDDVEAVTECARIAFRGYDSHYTADPRLDAAACSEVYPSWAHRSVLDPSVADRVVVATYERMVLGFATVRWMSDLADTPLVATSPHAEAAGVRRSALFRALVMEACSCAAAASAKRIEYSTQLSNIAVQRILTRVGYLPARAEHVFHLWLGDP